MAEIRSINPATESVLATFSSFDQEHVERILQQAKEESARWRQATFAKRGDLLRKAGAYLRRANGPTTVGVAACAHERHGSAVSARGAAEYGSASSRRSVSPRESPASVASSIASGAQVAGSTRGSEAKVESS